MTTSTPLPDSVPANERLKKSFSAWLWSSIILATVTHFGVFALWPELTATEVGVERSAMEILDIPEPIDVPPPPPPLTRPALPVAGPGL